MILTVPYPCRIKGTLVGGSKSRLFRYWDTIEVKVPDIPAAEIKVAAEMTTTTPVITIAHTFHAIEGLPGLFRATTNPANRLGHEVAKAFGELDDGSEAILAGRPNLREVERDYSSTDAAGLQRKMNDAFTCDGVLYLPSAEPYLYVALSPHNQSVIQVEWLRRKNVDGNIRSFRLPDWADAIGMLRAHNGHVDRFLKRVSINIHDADAFRYDPANGEIVYATRMILEMHENLLRRMTLEDATCWYNLRDAVRIWETDDDANPAEVIDLSRIAMTRLARYQRFDEDGAALIARALDRAEENFEVDEDLVAFTSAGPRV